MLALFTYLALVASVLLTALPTNGFWIISHHGMVAQRLDPIIAPNGTSGHTHNFVGSAAILPSQDEDDMCTTSPIKADLSKYWAPQLYYYHANKARYSSVPLWFVNTYYLNRGGPKMGEGNGTLKAFPKGLKMIAGNAGLFNGSNPDATAAKAISFVCLNYDTGSTQTTTLPTTACPQGLRTQVVFPSCWNGKDLDSSDHQSHMSYPVGGQPDTGDCPSTHPVKFMTLFYEFIWTTGNLKQGKTGKSGFVLANGDTKGYSFHADFVSGWDEDVLQDAVDQCTGNLFGDLKSCPPFVPSLRDEQTGSNGNSTSDSTYCTVKTSVDETVLGSSLKYLPGCQTIKNGNATGAGKKCVLSTPAIKAQAFKQQTSVMLRRGDEEVEEEEDEDEFEEVKRSNVLPWNSPEELEFQRKMALPRHSAGSRRSAAHRVPAFAGRGH